MRISAVRRGYRSSTGIPHYWKWKWQLKYQLSEGDITKVLLIRTVVSGNGDDSFTNIRVSNIKDTLGVDYGNNVELAMEVTNITLNIYIFTLFILLGSGNRKETLFPNKEKRDAEKEHFCSRRVLVED